jgi:protoheme IX farnesyltransferase
LILVSIMPFVLEMSGLLYLVGALGLGAGFLYYAIDLRLATDHAKGMRTFAYSISYLVALFSFLLVDHYVTLFWPS